MDSMRSLNTSLPTAYSSRQPPPEQLLQAFKTAALSVTNLYKAAVTDQTNSRAAGYQDALDDLMKFIDQENLGLQDGEGWRVRQWVSERYDGTANQPQSDIDDEKHDAEQRAHSAPPPTQQVETQPVQHNQTTNDANKESQASTSEPSSATQPEPMFRFTAGMDSSPVVESLQINEIDQSSPPPIRLELVSRGSRTPHRSHRHSQRSSNRDLTLTAGTKRKIQFPDFFDITNLGSGEGSAGSKRGRFA